MVPRSGVGAHVKGGFGGDPVEDHAKHDGKGDANLTVESFALAQRPTGVESIFLVPSAAS